MASMEPRKSALRMTFSSAIFALASVFQRDRFAGMTGGLLACSLAILGDFAGFRQIGHHHGRDRRRWEPRPGQ